MPSTERERLLEFLNIFFLKEQNYLERELQLSKRTRERTSFRHAIPPTAQ